MAEAPHTDTATSAAAQGERIAAYTTAREDVCALVPPRAQRVLDLGCSDGSLGARLKQLLPGRVVVGLDYSAQSVEVAAHRLDGAYCVNLDVKGALDILGSQRFDCAVMADVLEHLREPGQLLQALMAHLSERACIVVSFPNIRHLSALWAIYVRGEFPRRPRGLFDDTHLRWFTGADMRHLMCSAGFEAVAADYALRWGDSGGGLANRLLNRWGTPLAARWWWLREFLAYQVVLRCDAVVAPLSGRA